MLSKYAKYVYFAGMLCMCVDQEIETSGRWGRSGHGLSGLCLSFEEVKRDSGRLGKCIQEHDCHKALCIVKID